MATETVNGRAAHIRGITVTAVASLGGIFAGVVTPVFDPSGTSTIGLGIVLATVIVELGVLRVFGIDVQEFSKKDHLYVAFMTFALWFIVMTVLLTTGTSL